MFVNKPVTWPRQPAPRPWSPGNPREPPRDLASIAPAELDCGLYGSPTACRARSPNPRGQRPTPTRDRPAIPLPGGRLPGPASARLGRSGVLGDEGLHG